METHASFLGLSSTIRLRIYRMVIPQLDLCNDLNPHPSHFMIQPYRWAYSLMLACRIIYTEASSILYSGNHLFIRYRDHGNLAALRNLLPSSVASIRRLTIHLNASSCERTNLCCKGHKRAIMHDCTKKHGQPLKSLSPGYQTLLSEWLSMVSYLDMHISPSKLHLSLVCDVEEFEAAKAIMAPLLDWKLRPVASCNIRLGQDCNLALYDLARQAAAQAMRQPMEDKFSQTPFRFFDLPLELQYQILGQTDLVAPRREITWNPKDGFYLHYDRLFCENYACSPSQGGTSSSPQTQHGSGY